MSVIVGSSESNVMRHEFQFTESLYDGVGINSFLSKLWREPYAAFFGQNFKWKLQLYFRFCYFLIFNT